VSERSTNQDSTVIQFLSHVRDHTNEVHGWSWGRLNQSMHQAMMLAIGAGFEFQGDDFREAFDRFCGNYWLDCENYYAHAVAEGNLSAAQAYEAFVGREPFIVDNPKSRGVGVRRKRYRVAVGSTFPWMGEEVTVTSFGCSAEGSDGGNYLTACTYQEQDCDENGYVVGRRKIKRRYRITVADIRVDRKAREEWEKAEKMKEKKRAEKTKQREAA